MVRGALRAASMLVVAATLLVATGARVDADEPVTDPIGDGTPDIIAVATSFTNEELALEIEFADDYLIDTYMLDIAIADPELVAEAGCGGYILKYLIHMALTPVVTTGPDWEPTGTALPYAVSGPRVWVYVPLGLLDSGRGLLNEQRFVYFSIWSRVVNPVDSDAVQDRFPDQSDDSTQPPTCQMVTLPAHEPSPRQSAASAVQSPRTGPGLWLWIVLPVTLLIAIAALAVYDWFVVHPHRRRTTREKG